MPSDTPTDVHRRSWRWPSAASRTASSRRASPSRRRGAEDSSRERLGPKRDEGAGAFLCVSFFRKVFCLGGGFEVALRGGFEVFSFWEVRRCGVPGRSGRSLRPDLSQGKTIICPRRCFSDPQPILPSNSDRQVTDRVNQHLVPLTKKTPQPLGYKSTQILRTGTKSYFAPTLEPWVKPFFVGISRANRIISRFLNGSSRWISQPSTVSALVDACTR